MYQIILYYNFSPIKNVPMFRADHKRKCQSLDLLGRVYVSENGINGTLAGTPENIEIYKNFLREQPGFEKTEFKEDASDRRPFVKLICRIRPEVVALYADESIDPSKERGKHLTPRQWREVLESKEDIQLIDVRNNYESAIGYFEGAIRPDVKNFFDFPKWLEEAKLDKNKKTLMYCTGGIRCEVFSLYMEKKGFKDVEQLHGGIINYGKQEKGAHYKGKCFVFDDRLAVPIGGEQESLTKCEITGEPCDAYLNCANMDCNRLFICSLEGARKFNGCCSEECSRAKKLRPFDANDIYGPTRKWYNYYDMDKEEFKKLNKA